ncbi:MAG: hypothetical protein R2850_13700 [Bacteroidia bacterium]
MRELLSFLFLICPILIQAQNSGTIQGSVKDKAGAQLERNNTIGKGLLWEQVLTSKGILK